MPDGFKYIGDWKNGEISGEGVATYANGDVYEGTFVAGKRQGEGTMRYAAGQEASGEWKNGALMQADEPEPAAEESAEDTPDAPTAE